MRKLFPRIFPIVLLSGLAAMPALASNAGANRMKACASTWNDMSAVQKKGMTYQQFSADCMAGRVAIVAPPATEPGTQQDRMKACAAQWDQLKALGRTAGQTYEQYSASCLKH